ncbi:uncharacterized protein [Panulirus ornatus]|uniref:uncharacterized protein n=1 Tax=Panulirus ornatus TaxID=150431 RepID=UPI003A851EAF
MGEAAASGALDPSWNATNATSSDRDVGGDWADEEENERVVYICSALFSFFYILAGVVCCRCYWLHLRRKLEGGGVGGGGGSSRSNADGALKSPVATKAEGGVAKDGPDLVEAPVEEDNEFLETKCC